MPSPSYLRRVDPSRADRMMYLGARAAVRCTPGPQKRAATAWGISRSRYSRIAAGDPHGSPARAHEDIVRLARTPGASPWPLLTSLTVTALEEGVLATAPAELVERWLALSETIPDAERDLERAKIAVAWLGDPAPMSEADERTSELHAERAAVGRRLAELSINPLTWGRR